MNDELLRSLSKKEEEDLFKRSLIQFTKNIVQIVTTLPTVENVLYESHSKYFIGLGLITEESFRQFQSFAQEDDRKFPTLESLDDRNIMVILFKVRTIRGELAHRKSSLDFDKIGNNTVYLIMQARPKIKEYLTYVDEKPLPDTIQRKIDESGKKVSIRL